VIADSVRYQEKGTWGKGDGDYYLLFASSPLLLFTVSSEKELPELERSL